MKKVILLLLFALSSQSYAQVKITEDEEFKLSALPYYNYGKGLGMTSADSLFQFNIRFRMQNRITVYDFEGEETSYDAQIRRLRLRFDGYVGSPQFQYVIQLAFSTGDVGKVNDGDHLNLIRDAAITYKPNKNWNFIFGQTKIPGNRQRINSSGALQLTDRSINNASFNIDRDFGFQVYYLNEHKNKFSYNIKTALTTGNGRNVTDKDTNVALTGKLELLPFGTFTKGGDYFEGDLAREIKPKLMVSGGYHQNNGSWLDKGQQGKELFQARTLKNVFVDAILKYQGWSGMFAYMSRNAHDPITTRTNDVGQIETSYVYAGEGNDYQLSYTFPSKWEVIGRYSRQNVASEIYKLNVPNTKQFSLGVTKYIWEHAFKIQGEVTYDKLHFHDTSTKNNWYFRFQIEMGI